MGVSSSCKEYVANYYTVEMDVMNSLENIVIKTEYGENIVIKVEQNVSDESDTEKRSASDTENETEDNKYCDSVIAKAEAIEKLIDIPHEQDLSVSPVFLQKHNVSPNSLILLKQFVGNKLLDINNASEWQANKNSPVCSSIYTQDSHFKDTQLKSDDITEIGKAKCQTSSQFAETPILRSLLNRVVDKHENMSKLQKPSEVTAAKIMRIDDLTVPNQAVDMQIHDAARKLPLHNNAVREIFTNCSEVTTYAQLCCPLCVQKENSQDSLNKHCYQEHVHFEKSVEQYLRNQKGVTLEECETSSFSKVAEKHFSESCLKTLLNCINADLALTSKKSEEVRFFMKTVNKEIEKKINDLS